MVSAQQQILGLVDLGSKVIVAAPIGVQFLHQTAVGGNNGLAVSIVG